MPRINPQELLHCLSVLLSPCGGIKSEGEVQRIANLMTKFSKKLVSKCIYVMILKTTDADLLDMFMTAGGWDLIFNWLSDGITMRNWSLVVELVELLLLCPVDIERLKGNNCPKLIKMLSKEQNATDQVRQLASSVVERWLAVVKGACSNDPAPSSSSSTSSLPSNDAQTLALSVYDGLDGVQALPMQQPAPMPAVQEQPAAPPESAPMYKITIRDGKDVLAEVTSEKSHHTDSADKDESDSGDSSSNSGDLKEPGVLLPQSTDSDSDEEIRTRKKRPAPMDSDDDYQPPSLPAKKIERKTLQKKVAKRPAGESKSSDKKRFLDDPPGVSPEKKVRLDSKKKEELVKKRTDSEKNRSSKSSKDKEKERSRKDSNGQKERDNDTLNKLITPSIASLGKIPKKNRSSTEEKKDSGASAKKSSAPKIPPPIVKDQKKYNYTVETKRKINVERPSTVKAFNSRFRSTGLEEPPPPPKKKAGERSSGVSKPASERQKESSSASVQKSGGTSPAHGKPLPSPSPPHSKESPSHAPSSSPSHSDAKKKDALASATEKDKPSRAGGIILTPPKPLKLGLMESDVFADALTAANPIKDVKKKKRRPSATPEPVAKKGDPQPATSPRSQDEVKPVFKFYQDTLITSEDKKDRIDEADEDVKPGVKAKKEKEIEPESGPLSKEELEDEVAKAEEAIDEVLKQESKKNMEREKNRLAKGVLVYVKKKTALKKSVMWKPDSELESVRFFELDETERVNVTKNFTDMKNMERFNERNALRKLASEDRMEEKIAWRTPVPIELPPGTVIVPGKNSIEKGIQHARERTTLQAIYFNKNMIPDSPAEPDLEIHAATEPAIIPLEDQNGNEGSVISYKDKPWPEPKSYEPNPIFMKQQQMLTDEAGPMGVGPMMGGPMGVPGDPSMMAGFMPQGPAGPFPGPQGPFPPMGPPNSMMPGPEWMTNGDGSGMMMSNDGMMMPGGPGMPAGPMGGPGMHPMGPGMGGPMGPGMMGPPDMFPPMGGGGGPPDFMPYMPGPPGMFPGGPGGPPQFQGPPNQMGNEPNQRPWFRNGPNNGSGPGSWRHPSKGGGKWNKPMPNCKYILSKGFCRVAACPFRHPPNANDR
ncbi:protein phosphatase 1, regulatory subunit 10 [Nesidiocoris tenuis]|uniref:Protein phosphatase 1, regulatory subunit 10 n=1 Tax=Nesidiocoris tenuis TaxID=355587 RepID=A0ABN7AE62_9HEMI|nr:protein phosphatase 1, regulatory subunit 10 [Nesidiocoris tenuis]